MAEREKPRVLSRRMNGMERIDARTALSPRAYDVIATYSRYPGGLTANLPGRRCEQRPLVSRKDNPQSGGSKIAGLILQLYSEHLILACQDILDIVGQRQGELFV